MDDLGDFLLDIFREFANEALREGARITTREAYKYVSNEFRSISNTSEQLYHVGTNFYMNDGTILWYNFEYNTVYGYRYGNAKWVETNVNIEEDPASYNGGYSYF